MVQSPFLPVERGSGHQAPEWETWPVTKEDPIKAVRLSNAVAKEEKREKKWLPPGQIKQLAKEEGLEITDEQAEEFSRLRKERFERKGKVPWPPDTYPVEIAIRPEGTGSVDPPGGNFPSDTSVNLTAIPASGYNFWRWTGVDQPSAEAVPRTLLMGETAERGVPPWAKANPLTILVDWPKKLTAHFKKIPVVKCELEVKATPKKGGTVEPESGEYDSGTEVTITATPAKGYSFGKWSGDYLGIDNPITITVDWPKKLTAHFIKEAAPEP